VKSKRERPKRKIDNEVIEQTNSRHNGKLETADRESKTQPSTKSVSKVHHIKKSKGFWEVKRSDLHARQHYLIKGLQRAFHFW